MPAVSINVYRCPSLSKGMNIVSRVVPGRSTDKTLSSPKMRLIRVDFPTFGLPRTATAIPSISCSNLSFVSGIRGNVFSINSCMPWLCSAEISVGSPKPSS